MITQKYRYAGIAVVALVVNMIGASPGTASAQNQVTAKGRHDYVSNRIIVKYKDGATSTSQVKLRKHLASPGHQKLGKQATDLELVQLPIGTSVDVAIAAARSDPAVEFAEPDYILTKAEVSNDPCYAATCSGTLTPLWGMQGDSSPTATNQYGSQAAEVWNNGHTGSRDVVVGVIDEGIQIAHPDLAANIWTNPGEIAGNNIDDDGNGFRDDIHGWDFYQNNASVYDQNLVLEQDFHGTHVAGTIGAVGGNSIGVAGVNWNVSVISAKFLGAPGGTDSGAIRAINYLVDLKVNHDVNIVAINNSWGGGGFSGAMWNSINAAGDAGILFVAAAGNDGLDNDTTASYPANYDCSTDYMDQPRGWDCLVSVAAIDSTGSLAGWSNYGQFKVDIGAPGVGITSTVPNNAYDMKSGTSMATPHVTGAIALCASMNSQNSASTIRKILLDTAAATSSLTDNVFTNGRLDLSAMESKCVNPFVISNDVRTKEGNQSFTLTASGGPGSGAISFSASGAGCVLDEDGVTLTTTVFGSSCQVTAHKAALGPVGAQVSATETFFFTKLQQTTPVVVSQTITSADAGTPILLEASGGDGPSTTYTFRVTGSNCAISTVGSQKFVVSNRPTTCTIYATHPASGNYLSATSAGADFEMLAVAQAPIAVTNPVRVGFTQTPIMLTSQGGSGSGSITYKLAQPNVLCALSGPSQSLLTVLSETQCSIYVSKASNSIYAAAASPPVVFSFNWAETSSYDFPSTPASLKRGKSKTLPSVTTTGRSLVVKATGKCTVKRKYAVANGVKQVSGFTLKAKSSKGTCKLKLSTKTSSGLVVGPISRTIRVK
ncbi:MAG: S8 family serine peptidase [Actinobacteria bacterium]|uniref:Unannotated protein n=1 Tax=freshwater metagenome TaxID=449393 RepID=A0A6J5YYT4_9ZZZZ|nr:S8 family serine peptidase [Actinomycetota bacterium]